MNYLTNDTDLTAVAQAIRTKGGTTANLVYPSGFVSAIQAIPSGGFEPTAANCFTIGVGGPSLQYGANTGYFTVPSGKPSGFYQARTYILSFNLDTSQYPIWPTIIYHKGGTNIWTQLAGVVSSDIVSWSFISGSGRLQFTRTPSGNLYAGYGTCILLD